MRQKLFLFSIFCSLFFVLGCAHSSKEPTVPLYEYKKLVREHEILKKQVADFQNTTNDELAKLHLRFAKAEKKFNASINAAMYGVSVAVRRVFAQMGSQMSLHFKTMESRLEKLEKKIYKKRKNK